jgi:hypothetical protein
MPSHIERATKRSGLADWFVLSAGLILSTTGLAKIISAFGHSKILVTLDPIVGIRFKYLLIFVGFVEFAISFLCMYTGETKLAMALTAWLSTLFVGYRFGLWWLEWTIPCQCMGNLGDALHLPANVVDNILKGVLVYLLMGSWIILLKRLRNDKFVLFRQQSF